MSRKERNYNNDCNSMNTFPGLNVVNWYYSTCFLSLLYVALSIYCPIGLALVSIFDHFRTNLGRNALRDTVKTS